MKETCDSCGAYLHCCLNCRFYDEHAHNKCYIPTTDWVGDRAGCNFCDEFTFADADVRQETGTRQFEARTLFDGLFGDGSEGPSSEERGRGTFDRLFGD
ncbi:MAG TPA: hypothetical protein ENN80_09945 [Candidatus Hydrogenedentes bacterium]|nr:hypothetical protein [Candidatus Hydrogenedentota bacterium]